MKKPITIKEALEQIKKYNETLTLENLMELKIMVHTGSLEDDDHLLYEEVIPADEIYPAVTNDEIHICVNLDFSKYKNNKPLHKTRRR